MHPLTIYKFDSTTNLKFDEKYKGKRCILRYRRDPDLNLLLAFIVFEDGKWIRTSIMTKSPHKNNDKLIITTLHSTYNFTNTGEVYNAGDIDMEEEWF